MTLTDFTGLDDIRAALGVSVDEISDATLSLPLYVNNLVASLLQVDPGIITLFNTKRAIPEGNRTADEYMFVIIFPVYCTYIVAQQLTVSLPLFSPKEITDGQAGFTRYSQDPYKETKKGIAQMLDGYYNQVTAVLALLTSTTAQEYKPPTVMRVSTIGYDPVVGA